MKRIFSLITISLLGTILFGQAPFDALRSLDDLYKSYPNQIKSLFDHFDLDQPGLERVKTKVSNHQWVAASEALLSYYEEKYPIPQQFPNINPNQRDETGDQMLKDEFTFYRITDRVPRNNQGYLNWHYEGPDNDIEWAWALNRHFPLRSLFSAFQKTGNPQYAHQIDYLIQDWIVQSWPYPGVKSNTAMWRGLEVSFRAKVWSQLFKYFMSSDLISDATKLLILISIPDHAHYARKFHGSNNWLTMEITGLMSVATTWPEYSESSGWKNYCINTMVTSMKDQIYPDGVQTELSSHYHRTAHVNFILFENICKENQIELPSYYTKTVEDMWNYHAYSIRPNGYGILNNDSDLDYNRDNVRKAADQYQRQDWIYITSNGQEGIRPQGEPSIVFPWAGQMISRSDYDSLAHWSFFDIGPWGSGHQHDDHLHLSVSAFGKDFLVDGGRFAYRGELARRFSAYARGTSSHNTLLIDGQDQKATEKVTDTPLPQHQYKISEERDWAWSSISDFENIEGNVEHRRIVQYERGKYWIVIDQIDTDRQRNISTLWHWHPDQSVITGKNLSLETQNSVGNLTLMPAQKKTWSLDLVKGQETPVVQGWYSRKYNEYTENIAAIYKTAIPAGNHTFVWVIYPDDREASHIKVKIIKQNKQSLSLKIKADGEKWISTVPLPQP